MTYQVLARKWRPQDFSSVVGQEPVVTALRNALAERRIAHAYLFSGIRGVGKTSVARVLAKALNCERGPGPDPCNECSPCAEITRGADLDVLEIDAATYSKVEQVRELTESLQYGTARDRHKVVVLDEIHRLSRQAFDALLKIVEEPPPGLVFIFATTESEAVPATLLSRCQEFRFRRVPVAEVAAHLKRLAEAEEITASEPALRLLARAGEGSVRDSVALLDQLATYGGGAIRDEDARALLGGFDLELLDAVLGAILDGDRARVSALAGEIEAGGWDPAQLHLEFLAYCRDGLHLALGAKPEEIDLPREAADTLAERAGAAGYERLLRLLHLLLASENVVRRSEAGALALEIAWLRAAEQPKLTSLEAALAGGVPEAGPGGGGRAEPTPGNEPPPRRTAPAGAVPGRPAPAAAQTPVPAPVPAQAQAQEAADERPDEPEPPELDGEVGRFLQALGKRRQALAAHLSEAQSLECADGKLTISVPPGDPWAADALARPANRAALEEALGEVWGPDASWRLVERAAEAAALEAEPEPGADPVVDHPAVQTALELFGGTVRAVEEDR